MKPLLKNVPQFRPDIDNINYKDIVSLGFPLPSRQDASSLKLYLKLFEWPAKLDGARSANKIFDDFLLSKVDGGQRLYDFVRSPAHLAVKLASIDSAIRDFSVQNPFLAPSVPEQWQFDSQVPFSSIYVLPTTKGILRGTEADRAKASAQGVLAFHADLVKVYEKTLRSLGAVNGKRFFAAFHRCPDAIDQFCGVRVYDFPEKPLVFSNYRDLPMPQNPSKNFLSGLLLVKIVDYSARTRLLAKDIETLPLPGTEKFESAFIATWSHMLEVGSVFIADGR